MTSLRRGHLVGLHQPRREGWYQISRRLRVSAFTESCHLEPSEVATILGQTRDPAGLCQHRQEGYQTNRRLRVLIFTESRGPPLSAQCSGHDFKADTISNLLHAKPMVATVIPYHFFFQSTTPRTYTSGLSPRQTASVNWTALRSGSHCLVFTCIR